MSLQLALVVAVLALGFAGAVPVGNDSAVCSGIGGFPAGKDCHDVPAANRTPPLYPEAFTCKVPGYIEFRPFNESFHLTFKQLNLTWYYDYNQNALLFDSLFELGPISFWNNFTHIGSMMYLTFNQPENCFCIQLVWDKQPVGILSYDAFKDAQFLGRETITVEYGIGDVLVDHYMKQPGHNLWLDIETKLPIKFYQYNMGLQVYKDWDLKPVPTAVFEKPKKCFNFQFQPTCAATGAEAHEGMDEYFSEMDAVRTAMNSALEGGIFGNPDFIKY